MPLPAIFIRHKRRLLFVSTLAGVLSLSGCVADDEVDKATAEFVQASATLTQSYQALLMNANLVEADNFIVNQAYAVNEAFAPTPGPITDPKIKATAVLTDSEIKSRTDAIKALADYTTALATLAAGKPGAQIQADAATASGSVKSLTTDLTTLVVTTPAGGTAPNFASPAAAAATAIGDVLKVIENHQSAKAIRDSIKSEDGKITPLYEAMEKESAKFFDRQKTAMNTVNLTLLSRYNVAIANHPIDQGYLLQVSDLLRQHQKDVVVLSASDPTKAIGDFEATHVALVKLVAADQTADKKKFLAELIAEIKSFIAEVKTPTASPSTGTSSSSNTNPNSSTNSKS
jgi:hypothetical protein